MPFIKGKSGSKKNQFSSENQPKNRGRKPSIVKELQKMAIADGLLHIPADQVAINDDGSVLIAIPTLEQIALNMYRIAEGRNSVQALRAIKLMLDADV